MAEESRLIDGIGPIAVERPTSIAEIGAARAGLRRKDRRLSARRPDHSTSGCRRQRPGWGVDLPARPG